MASPLNVFRKYQTQVMAALLLVAIFTFIIGPSLSQYLSGQMRKNPLADKVAVTWSGGKLTEANLRVLHEQHNLLINFLEHLAKKAAEGGGQPKVTLIDRAVSDEDVVLRQLKAHKAEQLGLTITENTMIDYLVRLSDTTIPRERLNRALHEAVNERMDEHAMFQQLRTELLAQKLVNLTFGDIYAEYTRVVGHNQQPFAMPPSLAWDYFQRMHRRVRTEVLPLPVSDFVSKVKDAPTPAQIQALYEEYKDKFPDPYSPDPGFRKYNKVAFQYLKADFSKLLDEEKKKVTDEQIKEYYEKNKDTSYRMPELPAEKMDDKKPDDKKTGEKKTPGKAPAEKTPSDAEPEAKDADESPAPDKKSDGKPKVKSPADSQPPVEPEPKKPTDEPKACDDEPAKTEPNQTELKKAEPSQTEPAKKEPPKTDEAKSDEPKTQKSKTDDPRAANSKADDPQEVTPKEPDDPAAKAPEKADETKAKPKKKAPRYRPLDDKLKEEIRSLIARPLAQDRLKKDVKQVQAIVGGYGSELNRWEATSKIPGLKEIDKEPKPEPFVLKRVARDAGMEWGETPLVDALEISADAKRESPTYEIGKAGIFNRQNFSWLDFAAIAFAPKQPLYRLQQLETQGAFTGGDVQFFFWRIEEKPAYVPKLDECKQEVIDAWKRREALKLARDAAQKLAETVNKNGSPLKEGLPAAEAAKVSETESFSWRSRNTAMGAEGRMGISRIKKAGPADESVRSADDEVVESPGDDFMEAVFALKKGEAGAAVNHPQSIVYVVRIIDEPISEELLLQMFLDSPNKMDLYMLALSDRQRQLLDWEQELEKELKVKWHRESPDTEAM